MSALRCLLVALGMALCLPLSVRGQDDGWEPEPEPARFGQRSQWLIGGQFNFEWEADSWQPHNVNGEPADNTYLHVSFSPDLMYLLSDHWAFGFGLTVGYGFADFTDQTTEDIFVGGHLGVGYVARLGGAAFLFPVLSQSVLYLDRTYAAGDQTISGTGDGRDFLRFRAPPAQHGSNVILRLLLDLPVAFDVTEGFFVGMGPYVYADYAATGALRQTGERFILGFGISTQMGFWFD